MLCHKPTRRGTCRLRLSATGKCPVHDLTDLRARNAKVAQAFRQNNPDAFLAQRRAAGHLGHVATGGSKGWARANERAIAWRKQHRSEPERWCEQVLTDAGYTAFEVEYQIDDDPRTLDVAFVADNICLENGHQHACAFGETEPRAAKHAKKVAWLEERGWRVLVVNPTGDRTTERDRILNWLAQFPLRATNEIFDELPF